MKVIVMKNAYDISVEAADMLIKQINNNHGSVIGFATGASPVETYNRIIESYEKGEVSLKYVTTFNLDEYVGLKKDNPNSYYYFMKDKLFGKTDIDENRVNAIISSVESRIEYLQGIAISKRQTVDNIDDDVNEDVAEDYTLNM